MITPTTKRIGRTNFNRATIIRPKLTKSNAAINNANIKRVTIYTFRKYTI